MTHVIIMWESELLKYHHHNNSRVYYNDNYSYDIRQVVHGFLQEKKLSMTTAVKQILHIPKIRNGNSH